MYDRKILKKPHIRLKKLYLPAVLYIHILPLREQWLWKIPEFPADAAYSDSSSHALCFLSPPPWSSWLTPTRLFCLSKLVCKVLLFSLPPANSVYRREKKASLRICLQFGVQMAPWARGSWNVDGVYSLEFIHLHSLWANPSNSLCPPGYDRKALPENGFTLSVTFVKKKTNQH